MKRFLNSFGHAIRGIRDTVSSEPNAKIHLAITIGAIFAGFRLDINALEWCAVVGCIGAVIAAECLNTAIEKLADALHPEQNPLIGRAKDAAAGSVLLIAIASAIIGAIIFLPKLIALLP